MSRWMILVFVILTLMALAVGYMLPGASVGNMEQVRTDHARIR